MKSRGANALLEPDCLERLDTLAVLGRRRRRGRRLGEHLSPRRGVSLEFEDYRDYRGGDDIRYIDWNVRNRLGRYVVKRHRAEEDITVHLLVDASASMGFGSPGKLYQAVRMAASLGYIAWRRMDRVGMAAFSGNPGGNPAGNPGGGGETISPARRRGTPAELFAALGGLRAEGDCRFGEALADYALRVPRGGLAVVLSDFLDPAGFERGLDALRFSGFDILLIHVLSPRDTRIESFGSLRLVDSETAGVRHLRVDRALAEKYRRLVKEYSARLESYCGRYGIEYLAAGTETPFQELVLAYLRGGLFLR